MSTCTSSHQHCPLFPLLLLLLCLLSLHACTARCLAAVDDPNKSSEKQPHFPNMGNITVVPLPKVKSFSSSKPVLEVTEGSEITVETETFSNMKNVSLKKRKGSTSSSSGGADQKKRMMSDEHSSVSLQVPRKKRGIQKQPGFNLDYSPPKTHPPHHN